MYTHRVQYYETDQMGIVHHSNYIRWFEEARIDWMRHCGISYREMEKQGIIVPVLGVEATYRQMVHFDDLVDIKVTAAKYNGIILEFCYEIYHQKDGKLCTTGKSRHCFLNKEAKPVSLKKENAVLHQKILTFIGKDVQDPDKKQDRQTPFACQRSNRKGHGNAVIQKTVKNGSLKRFASIYDHAIFGSCDITSHFT